MVGDWRQLLPVIKDGDSQDQVNMCAKRFDPNWKDHVRQLELTINMRIEAIVERLHAQLLAPADIAQRKKELKTFNKFLLKIGKAHQPFKDIVDLNDRGLLAKVPMNVFDESSDPKDLINMVFGDLTVARDDAYYADRAILCPTNDEVNVINGIVLDSMTQHPDEELLSTDYIDTSDPMQFSQTPVEVLHQIPPDGKIKI